MWILLILTIHCTFWEAFCDMDVIKELWMFDTQKQCEQAIKDIRITQSGATLFCVKDKPQDKGGKL